MKLIIILLISLLFTPLSTATDINIYYPNNNTTTDIYYTEGYNYSFITSNNISGNFSTIILKNTIKSDTNLLESPHIIIPKIFSLFTILIFAYLGIQIIKRIKRMF